LTELLQDPANLQEQIKKQFPQSKNVSKIVKDEQSKIEKDLAMLDIQDKRILDAYREEIIELTSYANRKPGLQ